MTIQSASSRMLGKGDEERLIQDAINNLKPQLLRRVRNDVMLRSKVESDASRILLEQLYEYQNLLPAGYRFDIQFLTDPSMGPAKP
jgi:hypothetical protein